MLSGSRSRNPGTGPGPNHCITEFVIVFNVLVQCDLHFLELWVI